MLFHPHGEKKLAGFHISEMCWFWKQSMRRSGTYGLGFSLLCKIGKCFAVLYSHLRSMIPHTNSCFQTDKNTKALCFFYWSRINEVTFKSSQTNNIKLPTPNKSAVGKDIIWIPFTDKRETWIHLCWHKCRDYYYGDKLLLVWHNHKEEKYNIYT